MSKAIAEFHNQTQSGQSDSETTLARLLDTHPDLVNDVATGGASPLHTCGMSRSNQHATRFLISRGGDVAALDTYGYTPLDRMASNNLGVGAEALLAAGADPVAQGRPAKIARESEAANVLRVLTAYSSRKEAPVSKIVVFSDARPEVAGRYMVRPKTDIPKGFADVCLNSGWDVETTWAKLNGGEHGVWFKKDNDDAYIYRNALDGEWWIDGPDGLGVYKGPGPAWAPVGMSTGWRAIDGGTHAPTLAIFRA